MRKKRDYGDMPVGKLTIVEDFLPPPHELIFPDIKKEKITIELDAETIDFFKDEARKNNGKYQRLIRSVLQLYALKHRKQK